MERVIRIWDESALNSSGRVFLALRELLPYFEPDGYAWAWALQRQPDLVARPGWDFDPAALEQGVAEGTHGLQMSFEELSRFADRVTQVIWGEFIAATTPAQLPRPQDSSIQVGRSAIAGLAAIDSSYWIVGGPTELIERVSAKARRYDELSPSDWDRADD